MITNNNGYFGEFGGSFVPEPLKKVLQEVEENFYRYINDPAFLEELAYYQKQYIGRENPLYFAEKLTQQMGRRQDLFETRRPEPHRRP